jgi:hypothetical protein
MHLAVLTGKFCSEQSIVDRLIQNAVTLDVSRNSDTLFVGPKKSSSHDYHDI